MKKGFTLIELLAVLVILAIIAVITTPVVINLINSSKEKAFIQSAYSLEKAAQNYQANNGNGYYDFNFSDETTNYKSLKIEGNYPDSGRLIIHSDGKVVLTIWNDDLEMCVEKSLSEKTVNKVDKTKENCTIFSPQ